VHSGRRRQVSAIFSVQCFVRLQDLLAEGIDDLVPGRLMRLDNLSGKRIGIDDLGAEPTKNS
jgi:hypothetical protein